MSKWYAPGMYYPYWQVGEHVANNADTDTDMGDLSVDEFHRYFPHAFEISDEQYDNRTIDEVDAIGWARLLHKMTKEEK